MSDSSEPERPDIAFDDGSGSKLARKAKDSPMMILGLTSCAFIVGYGIYKYKTRGKLSTSNYLMQLRVTAQGAVIGCLTLGVMKSLYDRLWKGKTDTS